MAEPAEALGARVARIRRRRGLSQPELARILSRSVAWLSQVERGARHIDRMSVLESLATALDVSLAELASEVPVVAAQRPVNEHVETLHLVLLSTGLPALVPDGAAFDAPQIEAEAEALWALVHAGTYGELPARIEALITSARIACGQGADTDQPWHLLASAYHALAAAFAKLGAADAAWIASDRALQAARSSGDPVLIAAGAFRLTVVFQGAKKHAFAERTAQIAAESLSAEIAADNIAARSVWGALTLQRAVAASRLNDSERAYALLADAHDAAAIVGHGRNDHHTEFGPLNVAVHEVAIAVELGDAGRALNAAGQIDADALSPERHTRLLIDVARAHIQRRESARALDALTAAEAIGPSLVHEHFHARQILGDLLALTDQPSDDLRGLAQRSGLLA